MLWLGELALPLHSPQVSVEVRDVKDEPVIRLALQYHAVIVTGDKDMLHLPVCQP